MEKKPYQLFERHSLESFRTAEKFPITLVLDNIRSGLNVGSIFRTADAFSISEIHLCGITACPPDRELLKTALGANESVKWAYFKQTIDSLESLKQQGFDIIGIEQLDQSIYLQNAAFEKQQKIAFIFGNEVRGIDEICYPYLDKAIEIPQFGTKHSFNVAVSAGIILWEYYRKIST